MRVEGLPSVSIEGVDAGGVDVPIGMPRVYQAPDTVRDDEVEVTPSRPSAASVPGSGMLGMLVRTVNLVGS